jgi:hypothetical protein
LAQRKAGCSTGTQLSEGQADGLGIVTRPRQVLPNQFYLVTRRCTQRQFLLRPDREATNAIAYCLADAARRTKTVVLLSMVESNHHHTVIFDRHGTFPQFIEHFHKLTARVINALRGRCENVWSSHEACVTRLLDYETIVDKLAYSAANPVKDLLVENARTWPGLNGYRNLLNRKPLRAIRPRHFFRGDGDMPEELSLSFEIPPELGDADDLIAEVESRVTTIERDVRRLRAATGASIVGRRTLLLQSWNGSPDSAEAPRTLRPRFAGRREIRVTALRAYKAFLVAYHEARSCWLEHRSCVFPPGTYWLARFAPIPRESFAD